MKLEKIKKHIEEYHPEILGVLLEKVVIW